MPVNSTIAAHLLVPSALEAILSRASSRLDNNARLQRLHAAALMECALVGHAGLKMSNVAERAKVSTASIYKIYKDRDALLVAAMETLFSILARDVIEIPPFQDPMKQVEQLLFAHGEVYSHPLTTWLFRLYASLTWSGQARLRQTALQVFRGIDAFWAGFLNQLMVDAYLVESDLHDLVPYLLGPIERCTIIWQLGCGDDEDRRELLNEVAQRGAKDLFALCGANSLAANTAIKPITATLLPHQLLDGQSSELAASTPKTPLATRLSASLTNVRKFSSTEEIKTRILLAAAVLCQEVGYHNANMVKVADYAKVSTATLYKLYDDKTDLFCAALEQEFNLRVGFDDNGALSQPLSEQPNQMLASALLTIAARARDPDWIWIYNAIMASEISGTPRMTALARRHRIATEQYLDPIVKTLLPCGAQNSDQNQNEIALSINSLLGGVERSSMLSLILFGVETVETEQLTRLASVSTAYHQRLMAP